MITEKKMKILHFLVIIHIFCCWLVSNQWMFFDLVMRDAPQSSQVEIQEYLDDISSLKLTKEESTGTTSMSQRCLTT